MAEEIKKLCARCGSALVETSRDLRSNSNQNYPITAIAYRCTNDECQTEMDQRKVEQQAQKTERETRAKERQEAQAAVKAAKTS